MEYFALILIPLLMHICYTDFKKYKVHVFTIIFLIVLSFIRITVANDLKLLFSGIFINVMLLGIITAVIIVFAILKGRDIKEIIGGGDILFFLIATLNFSPVWFNFFVFSSAFLALIYILIRSPFIKKEKRIPYAGILALEMTGFLLVDAFTSFSCYNDNSLIAFFVK